MLESASEHMLPDSTDSFVGEKFSSSPVWDLLFTIGRHVTLFKCLRDPRCTARKY